MPLGAHPWAPRLKGVLFAAAFRPSPPSRTAARAMSASASSPAGPAPAQPRIVICLFGRDLRVHDNESLHSALAKHPAATHLLPMHVVDPRQVDADYAFWGTKKELDDGGPRTRWFGFPKCGEHRARFLVESLRDLRSTLVARGSDLLVLAGKTEKVVEEVLRGLDGKATVEGLYFQKEVSSEELAVEKNLARVLKKRNIRFEQPWGLTLHHVSDVPFGQRGCPEVFTQFRKLVEGRGTEPRRPLQIPGKFAKPFPPRDLLPDPRAMLPAGTEPAPHSYLAPTPAKPAFHPLSPFPFAGGESSALAHLEDYLARGLIGTYKDTRNGLLGADYSTKFSPFLANGCLSPRTVFWAIRDWEVAGNRSKEQLDNSYWAIFELLWRDFFKFLCLRIGTGVFRLQGPNEALGKQTHFPTQRWAQDSSLLEAWREGRTGVPFVDASARELLATGFTGNRSRQNVASFLAHSLKQDWRAGAEWYESLLLDHDPESNYGNWQYVSGVGSDPRQGRKFNVVKQAHDYDPRGDYIAGWIPELKGLDGPGRIAPWAVGGAKGYPKPVIIEDEWRSWARGPRGGGKGGKGREEANGDGIEGRAPRTSDWKVKRFDSVGGVVGANGAAVNANGAADQRQRRSNGVGRVQGSGWSQVS
ncbi:cryptochrome [Hyaloraphidium curvatum]|nr:cryptochrome [Hyaloraphidium curvatum]